MTIYLPIQLKKTGGTSTFAHKFQAGMKTRGHLVTLTHPKKYNALLASPRAPLSCLIQAKRDKTPVIHRLDGVFYPGTTAGWLYPFHNLPLRLIRNHFANFIVYQSKFSQQSCERYLGHTSTPSTIIYNGVDTTQFTPDGPKANIRDNPNQHVFITVSRFRRPDQIIPILDAFAIYREKFSNNTKLIIIGNFERETTTVPDQYKKYPGVKFQGIVPNKKLPAYLRAADVFVFTHRNPPCPNNVIEAMACGLPICGIASGAMPEIVTDGQEGKLLPTKTTYTKHNAHDLNSFTANMATCCANKQIYSKNARQTAKQNFALYHMITNYQHVIETLLPRHPLPA